MGIPYEFMAKCGHTATSEITDATPSKIRARRAYWRKTACRDCRESDLRESVTCVARCGHDVTAQLCVSDDTKSTPAQRYAQSRYYWKTHDCRGCYAQTPIMPAHRATFRCGHEDWYRSPPKRRPDVAAKYGELPLPTYIDMNCYACEDKDNPTLPPPTHRRLTYLCGHVEIWPEGTPIHHTTLVCGTCRGGPLPPAIPANAIISSRRPKALIRQENVRKMAEARRRERAGLEPWALPDDWRENPCQV